MEGIKIVSRESELAMVQARYVQGLIGGDIVGVSSEGDQNLSSPLYSMPGIGIFVKRLEIELLDKRANVAAHCLKDMPTNTTPGLRIAAILPFNTSRNDIALLIPPYLTLESLPNGSKIGTSSLRRIAMINHQYRHKSFNFQDIRGNLNTRLRKLQDGEYDSIILASAGIERLGWAERLNFEVLDQEKFLYAPGQGALALECRADDEEMAQYLMKFDDYETRIRCEAEREFMKDLEGVIHIKGCKLPIGVFSQVSQGELFLIGQVMHPKLEMSVRMGKKYIDIRGPVSEHLKLAQNLSQKVKEQGGSQIIQLIINQPDYT